MLGLLAEREQTVGQLAAPFQMSLAAASKHIKALESAGLVRREVQGRTHLCHLNAGPLAAVDEWLAHYERFWHTRLDRLEELLLRDGSQDSATKPTAAPQPGPRSGRSKSGKSVNRKSR